MQKLETIMTKNIQSGFYQLAAFVFLVLIDLTDGGNIAIMSLILPNLQIEFNLNSTSISLLTSVYYIGTAVGSIIVGKFSDKYGRRRVIIAGVLVQVAASFATSFCFNFYLLVFYRFIFGFGYGFSLPLTTVYITEIVPNKNRGKWIVMINFFVTIGKLYGTLLGYFILDNLTSGNWRRLVLISSILPCIVIIVGYFFLIESLRYSFVNGRFEEFENSFNKIVSWNNWWMIYQNQAKSKYLTNLEMIELKETKIESEFTDQIASYSILFSQKWLRITILLWTILFNLNFMFFGQMALLPYILKESTHGIATILLTISGEVPVIILTYFMIENASFGRKKSILYFSLASLSTNMFTFFFKDFMLEFFMFFTRFFMKGVFACSYPLSSESYPTSFRSVGYGFAMGVGRIGACIMPFFIFPLFNWFKYADFFLFGMNSAFCVIAAFFYPFDTTGKSLDQKDPLLIELKSRDDNRKSEIMD